MADWTRLRLNLRYHWKTVLVWIIATGGLVAVLGEVLLAGLLGLLG